MPPRAKPMMTVVDNYRIRVVDDRARVIVIAKITDGPRAMLGRSVHLATSLDTLEGIVKRARAKEDAQNERRAEALQSIANRENRPVRVYRDLAGHLSTWVGDTPGGGPQSYTLVVEFDPEEMTT